MNMKSNKTIIISIVVILAIVLGGFVIYSFSNQNGNGNGYITKEEAKRIAFAHVGVQEGNTRNVDVDSDYEQDRMVYQVEFDSDEFEYDYVIDAKTGEILYSEKGYDIGNVYNE